MYLAASRGMDGWVMRVYMLLSGFLLAIAFAPLDIAPVVFLLIPFFMLAVKHAPTPKEAFRRGWFMGFGLALAGLNWIGAAFTLQSEVPQWLAPIAIIALAAFLGLYKGLAFYIAKRFERRGIMRVVVFTFAFVAVEWMQGHLFTGFPWLILGSIWANWTVMLQGAALVGLYGLSIFTVFVAGSLLLFFEKSTSRITHATPLIAMSFLLLWVGFGFWRLNTTEITVQPGVNLRLVQANIHQQVKWHPRMVDHNFNRYLDMSRGNSETGKASGVDVIIWPETAVTEPLDRRDSLRRYRMSRILEPGAYILSGSPRVAYGEGGVQYYNSLFAIDSEGNIPAVYDKSHLVPFGEYVPLESIMSAIGVTQLVGGSGFSAGGGPRTMRLPGLPAFSPLICYEAIFPDRALNRADRPEWLLNVTNDGWFGLSAGPHQHLALTRMRAVEEGLPLVRVAGTGISGVIDPLGRDLATIGLQRQGIINSRLPKPVTDMPTLDLSKNALSLLMLLLLGGFALFVRESD